jgi:peroxiredoxin
MTTSSSQTIAAQVDAMLEAIAPQLPAEILQAFVAEQARLGAEGLPGGVARPGDVIPDIEMLDVHGAPTTFAAARAGRPAVLVFYRGAWCPYCNVALRAYQADLLPELTDSGIALIAVSPQRPDGSLSSAEADGLSYTVLSDPGNRLAGSLGILSEPGDGAKAASLAIGQDLSKVNADGTWTLPMPTVVLVNAGGVLRWIDVHPNYSERTEVADILAAVDRLH